jgi:DNA-directed RNA polymerase subunit RPC12/RpoP
MSVKYQCPKCGKRFVDWGAEKLGYKCPNCPEEELVRLGPVDGQAVPHPKLKRRPARISRAAAMEAEYGVGGGEVETFEEEDVMGGAEIEELSFDQPVHEEDQDEEAAIIAPELSDDMLGAEVDVVAVVEEGEIPDLTEAIPFDEESPIAAESASEEFEEE